MVSSNAQNVVVEGLGPISDGGAFQQYVSAGNHSHGGIEHHAVGQNRVPAELLGYWMLLSGSMVSIL